MLFRRLRRSAFWLVLGVGMLLALRTSTVALGTEAAQLNALVRDVHFDYVRWEAQAIGAKLVNAITRPQDALDEAMRSDIVRAYLRDLAHVQMLEAQVEVFYTELPAEAAARASAAIRTERDAMRASLAARQSVVEGILQGQTAAVLLELGFGVGGQVLPPVQMRFTSRQMVIVVSPRDAIRQAHTLTLDAMTIDARATLEDQVDAALDVSSLIVPIGGMALYPAMVVETINLAFIVETFAHEWLHHYLLPHPLGWTAELVPGEARIINETTATLFGQYVGRMILERYYPELVPPSPAPAPPPSQEPQDAPAPPFVFDMTATLRETRVRVDTLLAAGQVEEAEAIMEAQRQLLLANGFGVRKLNQAFFAFYGNYQAGPASVGGEDPTGPAVAILRERAPGLRAWVDQMRTITTRDALLAAVAATDDAAR